MNDATASTTTDDLDLVTVAVLYAELKALRGAYNDLAERVTTLERQRLEDNTFFARSAS